MRYSTAHKRTIYDRTGGYCHLCQTKLAFTNYGRHGEKGAWEIDHSKARALGGSDHGNNLFAACTGCNRSKGALSSKSIRYNNGIARSPRSRMERKKAKTRNTWTGVSTGALIGARLGGPAGALVGAILGGTLGASIKPGH